MPRDTGKLMLKTWLIEGFWGMCYIRETLLIPVTKGVRVSIRVVVSTAWLVLG